MTGYSAGEIRLPGKIAAYIVMGMFTLLTVLPLIWLFYSSFKANGEIMRNALALPKVWTVDNYIQSWKLGHLGIYAINSVIYTGVATTLTVLFGMSTGYAVAKFNFPKLNAFLFAFFVMGLLITVQSVLVPLFVAETRVGLANTRLGVILPYIAFGMPMALYIATSYIKNIPDSLQESALIDGANYIYIFFTLILPVARPVMATITILTFLGNWNEYVFVFILTSKDILRSLPVGINSFAGALNQNYGWQFAALVMGTFPMIVFYMFFHEELAKGFAEGALKE